MTTTAIREKLYDYIRVANEKKLKAIYVMLEDDIEEKAEWWKGKAFLGELDKRDKAWKGGKEKAFTFEEVETSIEQMKVKRESK